MLRGTSPTADKSVANLKITCNVADRRPMILLASSFIFFVNRRRVHLAVVVRNMQQTDGFSVDVRSRKRSGYIQAIKRSGINISFAINTYRWKE